MSLKCPLPFGNKAAIERYMGAKKDTIDRARLLFLVPGLVCPVYGWIPVVERLVYIVLLSSLLLFLST